MGSNYPQYAHRYVRLSTHVHSVGVRVGVGGRGGRVCVRVRVLVCVFIN